MYPECRHVRPSGEGCRAAALKGSHWCYFHGRLHERYTAQQARHRLHSLRDAGGRFTPAHCTLDPRPGQPSRPHPAPADPGVAAEPSASGSAPQTAIATLDYGPLADAPLSHASLDTPFSLPPVEDTASIQLALIEVLEALAANQIDPKRAGLLLYGLQVASSNAKHVMLHSNSVRSVSYTGDGIPLAPQEYGWDLEDIEAEYENDEEDDDSTE